MVVCSHPCERCADENLISPGAGQHLSWVTGEVGFLLNSIRLVVSDMWGVGGFIKEPNIHVREVKIHRSHSHIPPLTHSHLGAMTSTLLFLVACSFMSGVKSSKSRLRKHYSFYLESDPSCVTGRTRKIHLEKPLSPEGTRGDLTPRILLLWDIGANHCTSVWLKNLLFVCLYHDSEKSLMFVHTAVFHQRFPIFSFQGGKKWRRLCIKHTLEHVQHSQRRDKYTEETSVILEE